MVESAGMLLGLSRRVHVMNVPVPVGITDTRVTPVPWTMTMTMTTTKTITMTISMPLTIMAIPGLVPVLSPRRRHVCRVGPWMVRRVRAPTGRRRGRRTEGVVTIDGHERFLVVRMC